MKVYCSHRHTENIHKMFLVLSRMNGTEKGNENIKKKGLKQKAG
jgi:hypothetical protein